MLDRIPVYEEWYSRLVPSSHGANVRYRVFAGTVSWSDLPEDLHPAVVVLMQYGTAEGWAEATRTRQVALKMPAHVLLSDWPAVRAAVDELISRLPS